MSKLVRVLVIIAVLALLVTGTVLAQGGTKQVGLVVQFEDGSVHTEVVTVPTDATVADVLKNASVSVTISETSWGPALCAIGDTGCPSDNCFCNPNMFWAFYLQENGQWKAAPVGIGGYTPNDGEVVGFAWSGFDANYNPTVQPPFLTFDEIASPPPTQIPEPASMALLGGGLAALAGYVSRRRNQGKAA